MPITHAHQDANPWGIPPLIQLLTPEAQVQEHEVFSGYVADIDRETLEGLYRSMALTRRFDEEATALQRQGQLLLWVSSRGQEAAQLGSTFATAESDYIFPSYREHGIALGRGIKPGQLLALFRGIDTCGWDPKKHNFHPYTLVLAAQVLHATGYAMGLNFDATIAEETGELQTGQGQATEPVAGEKPAVITYFGDGSSTEGEIHESMVFAASYNAPVLFFVQNNRWAISVPFETQSRVPIATRAAGYGFEGIRVDGNDILAVIAATRYALEKIRAGEGPVLIEAETYRLGAHTTADDPTKYRTDAELTERTTVEPLVRLEKYLRALGTTDEFFEALAHEIKEYGSSVREAALSLQSPSFEDFFDRVYAQSHSQVQEEAQWYRTYQDGFED
ncbi:MULTISPECIES: thiamine pyrophosphate-dependent dehydrogenase E1 component subunit alpha [unclassified Rothia (in: high G+C Gram-positive bacteria)]|uniref:thiamine pyrophosphate-dependent dehydrogenase E1 component subunit alpha n=1 Tax=unclassified Rothia (in: high G+C Gram-positive bacteria) TaxID=2689056 RepID=UPI00195D55EF|nr:MULTISPECIES: thiamine pyrophosphate-dependent dehydrogenase E1 component subunit alpha [unclassified Rothia (in: high G+C Gram-positive bacteria)]MBM7052083.1 thiamine pyrophosphate-dependent dehydrogenase E1 component subunit alpha [Rothia sp. ZJ1223]QRZ61867.1 thiamine pyrophosphate-dependent dehydrogenase E1 component subunit alpha [Rothia sp. ZJ932]